MDPGQIVADPHRLVRSPHWERVSHHFKLASPYCIACGPKIQYPLFCLQVHHEIPFHFCVLLGRSDLELDVRNLLTLCQGSDPAIPDHHLSVGHEGDFRLYNPNVRRDSRRSILSKLYKPFFRKKSIPWDKMTERDKIDLRALMDKRFPRL